MDPKELRGLYEAYNEVYAPQENIEEASYSAKAARAGKDIGKPGKQFAKIAKEAGKRYGSEERGKKVAGAVLAKLRAEDVEIDEAVKGESSERRKDLAAERRSGIKPLSAKEGEGYASYKLSQMSYAKRKRMGEEVEGLEESGLSQDTIRSAVKERQKRVDAAYAKDTPQGDAEGNAGMKKLDRSKRQLDINKPREVRMRANEEVDTFDAILEYLVAEGYADTNESALVIMANMSEEWREDILAEAITSKKGKAKAAEMIAARTTASGRAKPGKGANVAQIGKILRSDREGLGGTPMTPTMAKNPVKKKNYFGSGNKAARRAGTYKESFNIFVNSMIAEGVSMERYTWEEIQNVFDDLFEAQVANRNPDEYERKAKQGQSREQQLKGRVMGRMSQMDPDKKAAMLKQMRAVGLDV